jgi:hypothetical protein
MASEITNAEIIELKPTMGFRVGNAPWAKFVETHPDGCSKSDLIGFVKEYMNPPYTEADLDKYLNEILNLFLAFIRE